MTWKDPFESDEEHEAFLADLYESRRRCANCGSTSWPVDAAAGERSREGVVPVTEDRQPWAKSGGELSPTNEELVRQQGVRPIASTEELFPPEDRFGSDEEHEAFLEWLYEMRRQG